MKLKFTLLSVTAVLFCLLMTQPSHAAPNKAGDDKEKAKEKKAVHSSRNNTAVKIYPDPLKRVMHVVAKENEGKEIEFFVFDLEGTLMQHYKMQNGDRQKLTGLDRGKYVYHVFTGDEESATGEIEIR